MSILHTSLLFALFCLLILSAFFSGTETAFFASNKIKIRHLAEDGDKRAMTVRRLLEQPGRLISTVLVGNNIVNIGATALATSLAISLFADNGPAIATVVMTLLVLVFGEITPKTLTARNPEKFALRVSGYIRFIQFILDPLVRILNLITGLLVRVLGGNNEQESQVTEEEIRMLVNVGQEEGLLDEDEREMIDSIFEFDDTLVREVMVPRIDIFAVDMEKTLEDVIEIVVGIGHSRIPVYEGTVDNIIGVIYAKDLLQPLLGASIRPSIKELMRQAYYVPESKKVRDLFEELRKEKVHMAIVLDEYGGTAGLVTIEDLIEEIVGDIQDEFDQEESLIEILEDGSLRVSARTSIYDINEQLELDLPDEEFDTISGLVFHHLGKLPQEGQELDIDNLHVVVEKITGRRIGKLHIWRTE